MLTPKGIDIIKIITDPDNKFDNIIDSFVGIGAVQIGLVDILKEIGVVPDYIIGEIFRTSDTDLIRPSKKVFVDSFILEFCFIFVLKVGVIY